MTVSRPNRDRCGGVRGLPRKWEADFLWYDMIETAGILRLIKQKGLSKNGKEGKGLEDREIIELYWARDERAIAETQIAYAGYCRAVAANILADPQDVEEVLSDTWFKAWNSIPPQKPAYLKLYLAKITRNLSISACRSQSAQKRGGNVMEVALEELGQCASEGAGTPETEVDALMLRDAIQRFLLNQTRKNRMIFVRRYFYLEETAKIARHYGIRESNVLLILSRMRSQLRKYLHQEGYML